MKDNLAVWIGALVIIAIIGIVIWASWGAVNCWIDGGVWVKPTAGLPTCVEPK